MNAQALGALKSFTVEAVVIRADGSREDLGVVARWDRDEPDENKEADS